MSRFYNRKLRTLEFILVDSIIIIFSYWFVFNYANVKSNLFSIKGWYFYILGIIVFKIFLKFLFGLYKLLLDFVGFSEFIRIFFCSLISNIIVYILFLIIDSSIYPFHLLLFITPIEFLLIALTRFSKRILHALDNLTRYPRKKIREQVNTLVIGAGSGGKLVLDEIHNNVRLNNKVIAFLDDDEKKIGKRLNGIPIYGPIANVKEFIEKYNIAEVIIAIASLKQDRLREIISLFENENIKIKRLPLMTEVTVDKERRIIDVKIEDLLSRGVVDLDNSGIDTFLENKTILVTGGGGSIGSELCHQIITYKPKTLIIFDIYENTTYNVQLDLQKRIQFENLPTELIVIIGSVYNEKRIEYVFNTYRPQVVFHAAAYKHVPLMENNAVEAVRTNVLGTYNVARLCDKYEIEKMVLVSTDKAVRPTNIMGATKSCCEKIIKYFSQISKTSYSAVRFGNVLGSHGSVVPLFMKQIAYGGPVTITHKEITRYFMTIPEAVSLILLSGVYATGGEIFILDMGEPVKIYDLAKKMIQLSGFIPGKDIKIEEIGLRPGEKLYEELLLDRSKHEKTQNDKIFIDTNGDTFENVEDFIENLRSQFDIITNQEIKEEIQKVVSDYVIYCEKEE